ncbi:MAG: radical SAM protein [Candidatus Thorarchaeota archaeon]|nr:radical SAM protein [Candidatus Thorarchaeota archaeon]
MSLAPQATLLHGPIAPVESERLPCTIDIHLQSSSFDHLLSVMRFHGTSRVSRPEDGKHAFGRQTNRSGEQHTGVSGRFFSVGSDACTGHNWCEERLLVRLRKENAGRLILNSGNYWEIRWELVGTNLGSRFSTVSTPTDKTRETAAERSPFDMLNDASAVIRECIPQRTFMRFLGGEPTMYWGELMEFFRLVEADSTLRQLPIVIHTNGVDIGTGKVDLEPLETLRLHFLFELSLKGTSDLEFVVLTGERSVLYQDQLRACEKLRSIMQKSSRVSVIPVLGYYHTAARGTAKFYLVNPATGRPLFDNTEKWDPSFRRIWESARVKWVDLLRLFPMVRRQDILDGFGPQGAEIIAEDQRGVPVNPGGIFPLKPKPSVYAKSIVDLRYWER